MEIESETQQEEEQKHIHVLAVDDSFIDRKLLEKLLKVSSYHVTCVESGDKALEYLGLNAIDDHHNFSLDDPTNASSSSPSSFQHKVKGVKVNLIMTDYCMPGMSGYDLLKRVKGSSWKDVPVVVMSSENVPSRVSMCLEEGAEEFLLKPVQLSDLKKIHPCILRSLPLSPKPTAVAASDKDQEHEQDQDQDQDQTNSSEISDEDYKISLNADDNCNNNNSISSSFSKRKALSTDIAEKRAKNEFTEMALVV